MKCYLMNKNKEVALIELNPENLITKIYKILNVDYAPLCLSNSIKNKVANNVKVLNNWFQGRGIPNWRKDIENLLNKLQISSPSELLNKAYGLSLSDQYWIKEENQNIQWENINFFTNPFKYKGYFKVSLNSSTSNDRIDLYSPNNTTDGMLLKAWVIEDGYRVLIKGTYSASRQEPINEWIVSQICDKLNLNYCNYTIDVIDNKLVSKCNDFINENEEILTAYDIFFSEPKNNNINDMQHYINILEKHGLTNAKKDFQDMLLIDFLVMNFDRHLKNFGVIRNVETLKWERLTPIFDTGECMQCNKLLNEINFNDDRCKFFTNTNKKISDLSKYINFKNYDFSKLDGIPELLKSKLQEVKSYTDMSDERIEKIYLGLQHRIKIIKEEK